MLRLLTFLCLLAALGCNSTTGGTTEVSDATNPTSQAGGVAENANEAMAQGVTSGDNYTVTTLDGSIKSPRRELRGKLDGVDVTINYGSPAVNGRNVYGELVPYGKVWRTGANEATRITFSAPVEVGEEDKVIPAGTYSLFTMPTSDDDWTVIFNKVADQWGAYDYSDGDDVARIKADVDMISTPAERMDFMLDGDETIALQWADRKISFEVEPADD